MSWTRSSSFPTAVVFAAFVLTVALYTSLPDQFPIHWNGRGQPDGYGGRPMAFGLPMVMLMLNAVMSAQAEGSPASATLGGQKVFRHVQLLVMLGLLALHAYVLTSATGAIAW